MSGPEHVEIEQFQGMVSNQDPHDLEPGQAMVQINVWSPRAGELHIRPGLRQMTWDGDA